MTVLCEHFDTYDEHLADALTNAVAYCHEHNVWAQFWEYRWNTISGACGKREALTSPTVYLLTQVPDRYLGAPQRHDRINRGPLPDNVTIYETKG